MEGLSPNKEYQFRVVAENLYGRSQPCEATSTVKTEADAVKGKGLGYDVGELNNNNPMLPSIHNASNRFCLTLVQRRRR